MHAHLIFVTYISVNKMSSYVNVRHDKTMPHCFPKFVTKLHSHPKAASKMTIDAYSCPLLMLFNFLICINLVGLRLRYIWLRR